MFVHAEGEKINEFIEEIKKNPPPNSHITEIKIENSQPLNLKEFKIKKSKEDGIPAIHITPDLATCEECLKELFSKKDRRFMYPFINCTHCGPRYTIIISIPYDRKNTTMKDFKMCPYCKNEYQNPLNRRFHAQPVACPECGPQITLFSSNGKKQLKEDPLKETVNALKEGKIIAIKGIGGFHIACDATSKNAVLRLRRIKKRPRKPFALMAKDIKTIEKYCEVNLKEKEVLKSSASPILLLKSKTKTLYYVAPKNKYIGMMLPYTPLHHLIMKKGPEILIMTSANIKDEPIIKDKKELFEKLPEIDLVLDHNRNIENRIDDSVLFQSSFGPIFIRRARGYTPSPISSPISLLPSLSTGAEKKNTFSLGKSQDIFLSPHIGELTSMESLKFFEETLEKYKKWFGIEPEIIACDLHPDYLSTRWAENSKKEIMKIQHHFAHIVATMSSWKLNQTVIGIAMDGTGYGEDGRLWGGELLLVQLKGYERIGWFEYMPLPGGEKAIKNPKLIAEAYLIESIGRKNAEEILKKDLSRTEKILKDKRFSFYTSSTGRLFDAVSALIGVTRKSSYEGEAPGALEWIAEETEESYEISMENKMFHVKHLVAQIAEDIKKGERKEKIAGKFHRTIAKVIKNWFSSVSRETGIKKLCLGGGVFQNRLLLSMIKEELKDKALIFLPKGIPVNDGGISVGQIVALNAILRRA